MHAYLPVILVYIKCGSHLMNHLCPNQCCHGHDRCFSENWNYGVNKIAKTVKIFVEIEHIKNRRVTFWPERIGPVVPMLWSGYGTTGPILLGQNVTLRFLMCSISTNILMVLAILLTP